MTVYDVDVRTWLPDRSRHQGATPQTRTKWEDEADWMRQGLCAEIGPDLWFPSSRTHQESYQRQAADICNGALGNPCPVREQCLRYALEEVRSPHGVWGGMTERDRFEDFGVLPGGVAEYRFRGRSHGDT